MFRPYVEDFGVNNCKSLLKSKCEYEPITQLYNAVYHLGALLKAHNLPAG